MINKLDMSATRLENILLQECGSLFLDAFFDSTVIELMINADGKLWLDHLQTGISATKQVYSPLEIDNILALSASLVGAIITPTSPILESEFPIQAARLTGVIPPITHAPILTLRKHAPSAFQLKDFIHHTKIKDNINKQDKNNHYLSPIESILTQALQTKNNILVIGGTGSGKTAFVNALLAKLSILCPQERVVLLEDTRELKAQVSNQVALRTSTNVDLAQLLRTTLRLRPDRIIVGEVRGPEALTLLKTWNTGHPGGLATLHANSPYHALLRLGQLVEENPNIRANPYIIAETVDIIIQVKRNPKHAHCQIVDIVSVQDYRSGRYQLQSLIANR